MFLRSKNKDRPFHWGPYALERLPHDNRITKIEEARPPITRPQRQPPEPTNLLGKALSKYHNILVELVSLILCQIERLYQTI